jgi:hypothetical protein
MHIYLTRAVNMTVAISRAIRLDHCKNINGILQMLDSLCLQSISTANSYHVLWTITRKGSCNSITVMRCELD